MYMINDPEKEISMTFYEVPQFTKKWFSLGFTDDELAKLENRLVKNPNAGDLMVGTGGIRKMRIAYKGKGKSGGARVCYVSFAVFEKIYFIDVFLKDEKENLSNEEKNDLKEIVKMLKNEASKKRG